jgi:hypothetical protein
MVLSKREAREATMNNKTTTLIRLTLTAALGIAVADVSQVQAQSTLGGARPQQSKIGGVAKPAPVVGGATVHAYSPPKPPGPIINFANKPGTPKTGTTTPSALAATNSRPPNAPVITPIPNKNGKVANLKCVSGACMSRGAKP